MITLHRLNKFMKERVAPGWMATLLATQALVGSMGGIQMVSAEGSVPDNVIGIDLGTTFSVVAAMMPNGKVEVFENSQGSRTTASVVAFLQEGEQLIGTAAKNQAKQNPKGTVFDSKRLIGRKFNEISPDLKSLWPFTVINKNSNPHIQVEVDGKKMDFAPEQISAKILTYMKETAEEKLGKKVTHAVITVPAYFTDSQRQATKDAGTIAGLEVLRIINEPTAAAMAYGLDNSKENQKILVFDLGGGTFDVSCLEIEDGVFEVRSTAGDSQLGGQDFDNKIIDWIISESKKKPNEVSIDRSDRNLAKLRAIAEEAKKTLSNQKTAKIEFEHEGKMVGLTLSRAKFEELNVAFFERCMKKVDEALSVAKWDKKDIKEVVLVGGSTRIPKVQEMLKAKFDGRELNKSVNPDEAVAIGAAIQAAVLMGRKETKDILLVDVTPLSLGIETVNGVFTILIPRSTSIPVKKTQIFSTASDNQSTVSIKVFEGERDFVKDNHLLGSFDLTGIPMAPRGVPQIEVTFEVDANGILTVSAHDKGSGNKQNIKIKNDKGRLTQEQIEKMIKEAEEHKEEDRKRRETIEARDDLERYVYQLKDQVNDEKALGSKVSASEKETILEAVKEAAEWVEKYRDSAVKEDYEEQKSKVEKVVAPIIAKLYKEGGAAAPGGGEEAKMSEHEDL